MRCFLFAFALAVAGCCPIPFPSEDLVIPSTTVMVATDEKPVDGASVTLARFEYHPHFRPETKLQAVANAGTNGVATFQERVETSTVMPLMMHGVPGFGWQICAEADGFITQVVGVEPAADGEQKSVSLNLKAGESRPCSELLGVQELRDGQQAPPP